MIQSLIFFMRYHYSPPAIALSIYGTTYSCDHPVYNKCTLYLIENRGLAVIQQRFYPETKCTYWTEIDSYLVDELYLNDKFLSYFDKKAGPKSSKGLYPTVTVRQLMWAMRVKPLPRHIWETVFDKSPI